MRTHTAGEQCYPVEEQVSLFSSSALDQLQAIGGIGKPVRPKCADRPPSAPPPPPPPPNPPLAPAADCTTRYLAENSDLTGKCPRASNPWSYHKASTLPIMKA